MINSVPFSLKESEFEVLPRNKLTAQFYETKLFWTVFRSFLNLDFGQRLRSKRGFIWTRKFGILTFSGFKDFVFFNPL